MGDSTPKQRIQQLSLRLGMNVSDLATIAKMSKATLYHITDESRTITPKTAAKICYNLKREMGIEVNREWLLTGDGEMLNDSRSVDLLLASEDSEGFGTDRKAKCYTLLEQYTDKHTDMNIKIGDSSENGQITIIDEDRLFYLVKSASRGAEGIRTISKSLLSEYITYFSKNPNASANDARDALCGNTDIDKFEYGYTSTLKTMAQMALGQISIISATLNSVSKPQKHLIFPLQQIFYGSPGTGKSHTVNKTTSTLPKENVFRTTFHPDSDYSTFVGCYKPTMKSIKKTVVIGQDEKEVKPLAGGSNSVEQIAYDFVPQAFTKAYCEAWNHYNSNGESEPVFLVIEEINRGNCAQIFGDIFQLLDRETEGARCGYSTYPIDADEDLKKFLLNGTKEDGSPWLNNKKGIENGQICFPPNFHIWATMNTSDQSLFPIDSAFKRRWDWKYIPIEDHKDKNWKIAVGDQKYDWWEFLEAMNKRIYKATDSEDKKMGYFWVNLKMM